MTTRQTMLGFAGAALMASGGATLSTRLELSPLPFVAFAIGILCFALTAVAGLAARVAELERRLKQSPGDAN